LLLCAGQQADELAPWPGGRAGGARASLAAHTHLATQERITSNSKLWLERSRQLTSAVLAIDETNNATKLWRPHAQLAPNAGSATTPNMPTVRSRAGTI
jgi:hypothetical protein